MKNFTAWWLEWPLLRWIAEHAGQWWFTRRDDRFVADFTCPPELRAAGFSKLTAVSSRIRSNVPASVFESYTGGHFECLNQMPASHISPPNGNLLATFARKTFIIHVSLESDMQSIRRNRPGQWTMPRTARPGDRLLFYKPGAARGRTGITKPPYGAYVAAGVVHGKPRRVADRTYMARVGELVCFPSPVFRARIAESFPQWPWLRTPQGTGGAQVPANLQEAIVAMLDRLAFR